MLAVLILFIAMLPGCRPEMPASPPPGPPSAIIFIPGFKGTALARADGQRRIWITLREAMLGDSTLAANGPALGIGHTLDLTPDGILKSVSIIPGLYEMDIYASWLELLHDRFPDARLIEFAYDWRQDPLDSIHALQRTVAGLRAKGVSVTLMAHSLGGLIASYYLRYGAQDPRTAEETWEGARAVQKVVLAGVPFRGAINKFRDMQLGESVGGNRALLDAAAHASFASSYYLIPTPTDPALVSDRLEPFDGILHAEENWQTYRWGLFQPDEALSERDRAARAAFVTDVLDRAVRFSRLLLAPIVRPPSSAPKVIAVIGRGRVTPARAIWRPEKQELIFNDDERLLADGDGVVTAHSATLPAAYQAAFNPAVFYSRHEHMELWTDNNLRQTLLEFLADGGS